ncbi:hypothetical protein AC1031_020897 [Aphanomyces cochlioides]|nr:hypothetical protein AC1031_020897 [Aphanomyces cochlioides]
MCRIFEFIIRGFSLESRSIQRFCGVRISDGRLRIFWTKHHSVTDGWSSPMLLNNFFSLCYDEETMPTTPFRNHIEWLTKQDTESSKVFWRESLKNLDKTTPLVFPKPEESPMNEGKYANATSTVHLPDLKEVCKRLGTTASTIFRTAWSLVLQQYTRSDYIKFGSVVSGRDSDVEGVEQIISVMINTVPILVNVSPSLTISQVISSVHDYSVDLAHHGHYSLSDIKSWSQATMTDDIFETIVAYENYPSVEEKATETRSYSFDMIAAAESTDAKLTVAIVPDDDDHHIFFSYSTSDVSPSVIRMLQDRFAAVITKITCQEWLDKAVIDLDEPCDYERSILQTSCYGPSNPLPYELLHHAFEERAAKKPHLLAVEYEGKSITYGELNDQATTLAHELVSLGVGVGSRVAVVMERCLEFPIGLLAVLKAGGSMMPLDATFPANRLTFMLGDANASVVVTTEQYRAQLAASQKTMALISPATRNDEAYVVYTSGSTGKPKGVPVLHCGAVNCIEFDLGDMFIDEGMRMMQFRAIGSDVFEWEVWKALSRGAGLVFRSDNVFTTLITVDILSCTPTGLSLLGNPKQYPNLKLVAVGGEALSTSLKDLWSEHVVLTNCYGPSECAIQTHERQLHTDTPVTVGKPMQNVSCYILDESQRQVPVGAVGEFYLGGICVSPGYINLPEQTAERFLDDPFVSGGGRMFRTGDFGRLLPNGNFEVLGRKDSQVKLKGCRIELEEIGETMMRHPQVTAAAAIVKDKTHLVGYFTPPTVNVDELRSVVSSYLPVYMVPAVWVPLESMPQSTSGKTDRLALEAMDVIVEVESLETEVEKRFAIVWSQVLKVDASKIGRTTSFFALGGDSISAIRLVAKAKQAGFVLTSSLVMKHSTLDAMLRVAKLEQVELSASKSDNVHGIVPLTPIQHATFEHPWKNIHFWNLSMTLKPRSTVGLSELRTLYPNW